VEQAAERVVDAHVQPCQAADREGVPCFPVSVEQEGPRFSVAEALRLYRGGGRVTPGVGLDPGCGAKKLFRKLKGKVFYVYRTWDARGERPLLTDRPLDPKAYAANPAFRYALVGKYSGDCEALAAWRKALREANAPAPLPDDWDERADAPPP
jgi:hypothetical protein